ncbi:hypothetical protein [Natrinema salsiterrestre]|uniref:Uncharacterized protein n=1 Tax=Natrinema salsiterrestre TaxID=2950540 RepID=A0A9Q4L9B6_9EURY|nr:hypothetical protein [Natrinema salsiterrestre]MDF9748415.1 hypothetical protein [Natrinema salsiterrestre]
MQARKRLNELAHKRANAFDATICHNKVYETVQGHHDHGPDLQRYVSVAEDVYELSADEDLEDRRMDVFGAAETVDGHIDDVVDEVTAAALADMLEVIDDWGDDWDDAEIEDAKCEARDWLQGHSEAADRAGVWEKVTA